MVIVVGGSGDFFDQADTVIAMREYSPREVTAEAKKVVRDVPTRRSAERRDWVDPQPRVPEPAEIKPRRGRHDIHIKVHGTHRISFGQAELDLSAVEQLVEPAQTRAIARALGWSKDSCVDGEATTEAALRCVIEAAAGGGLDEMDPRRMGNYAEFRIFELGAVLNRLR